MSEAYATPRVGGQQLKNFVGRKVIFVGRVENMEGSMVHMRAADNEMVSVQSSSAPGSPIIEIVGTVQDPRTIVEEGHVNLNENFGELRVSTAIRTRHLTPTELSIAGQGSSTPPMVPNL